MSRSARQGRHFVDDSWDDDDYEDDRLEAFQVGAPHHHLPRWLKALGLVVVIGLLAGVLSIVWIGRQINPPGRPGAAVQVDIPKASSTARIASILSKDGVIHSPSVFRLYVKISAAAPLLPGTYTLHRNQKYGDVVSVLEKGPPIVDNSIRLTIPEGLTLAQIAARVATLPGRSADKFLAAATSGQIRSRYEPAGSNNLEGLVFPATYQVSASDGEATILQRMVQKFDDTATTLGLDQAAAKLGISVYQLVTVGSIVEREGKLDADRGPIASVIYNRIAKGMFLQIDSPLLYGEQLADPHKIDLKAATPYNDYKFKGLPPTPIASPGVASLEAASSPPSTTYLYFVLIDPNGQQAFASTAADFARLRAEAKAKGLL